MKSVVYRDGSEKIVSNPVDFPDYHEYTIKVLEVKEPMVNATIIVPNGKTSMASNAQILTPE